MSATRAVGTYGEALARLASAQKGSRNVPAYSRWVNRPLGRRAAALAYLRGMTPDAVTALSACFTFPAIVVVAVVPATPLVGVAVGLALVVGYALDAADGQLARLRGGGSVFGEWLDHVADAVKTVSLHLAVLISWYRSSAGPSAGPSRWWVLGNHDGLLLVPIVFTVVATTFFFGFLLTDQLRRSHGVGRPVSTSAAGVAAPAPVLGSLLTLPNDYGLLCLVFLLLGVPSLFVPAYSALLLGSLAFLAAALWRWAAEMRAADHERLASGAAR